MSRPETNCSSVTCISSQIENNRARSFVNAQRKCNTRLRAIGFYPLKLPFLSFLSGGMWLWRTFFSRVWMSSEYPAC